MSWRDWGGITQSGSAGCFTYAVRSPHGRWPVTLLSFWSACRYANWLTNGQPTGTQGPNTTETGIYMLNGVNPANGTIGRDPNAWDAGG